jgi:hypothetical protein
MSDKTKLNILWTNDNIITSEKMVFMYGINSRRKDWWEEVTIIIWGAPAKLVSENKEIQDLIHEAQLEGVHITACKACTDQLGVTDILKGMGVEVKYWGEPLTKILKSEEKLITI